MGAARRNHQKKKYPKEEEEEEEEELDADLRWVVVNAGQQGDGRPQKLVCVRLYYYYTIRQGVSCSTGGGGVGGGGDIEAIERENCEWKPWKATPAPPGGRQSERREPPKENFSDFVVWDVWHRRYCTSSLIIISYLLQYCVCGAC